VLDRFAARLREADGVVETVTGVDAARDHIARICEDAGGPAVAAVAASELAPGAATVAGDLAGILAASVGVSRAVLGVAETGSVLLAPASRHERLVALLPPVHVVVLDSTELRDSLNDAAPAMHALLDHGAPYLTLVSGPSRTADIERVITVGAHGPRRLHVLVVEARPGG
jgi:L-lactate dehydrogenase complex protein LldG